MGNKCDQESAREVPKEEAQEFANQFGMPFLETSAKNSVNVDEAFLKMTKEIKDKLSQRQSGNPAGAKTSF